MAKVEFNPKPLNPAPQGPQMQTSDDLINQYVQSQMATPAAPKVATKNYDYTSSVKDIYSKATQAGGPDWLGILGTGLETFNKQKQNQADYEQTAAGQLEKASKSTDPYAQQAYLDEYKTRGANEKAQAGAYTQLLADRQKNLYEVGKTGKEQEITSKEKALDRGVQYSQLNQTRDIAKTDQLMNMAKQFNMPIESLIQIMGDNKKLAELKNKDPGKWAMIMNVIGTKPVRAEIPNKPPTKIAKVSR